jgi:hypothetical protein
MSQILVSNYTIRKALGGDYHTIRDFDDLAEERRIAGSMVKRLMNSGPFCASCGQAATNGKRLEGAHILALEEGGRSRSDNLVLLCHDCHRMFDEGYASRNEMAEAARAWRGGSLRRLDHLMQRRKVEANRQQATVRPLVDTLGLLEKGGAVYGLLQARRWRKALRALREARRLGVSTQDDQVLAIVEAQTERRRGAIGALERGSRLLREIDPDGVQSERRPLFFYELGYTTQLLGFADKAASYFSRSRQAALELTDDECAALEALIGWVQELAAITIGTQAEALAVSLLPMTEQIDAAADRARQIGGHFGGRWVVNCHAWKLNLLMKCGDCAGALKTMADIRSARDTQNVTTGWTVAARPGLAAASGLLPIASHGSYEEIERGLHLLARALVPLVGGLCQHPEGIRDKLLGFERGLELLSLPGSDGLRRVRERIRDGSSFLDPYRATEN